MTALVSQTTIDSHTSQVQQLQIQLDAANSNVVSTQAQLADAQAILADLQLAP